MMSEHDEIRLSELADGELDGDQAAETLLAVLDDAAGREKLKAMLRMRQSLAAWRQRQPARSVVLGARPARGIHWRVRRWGGMAAAACVGGLLVLAGFWSAGDRTAVVVPPEVGPDRAAMSVSTPVTPEQMRQVAKVFALHESVAGPLAWYASDDQNIRVAAADDAAGQGDPVAVLLTLVPTTAGGISRTYVIVCRERQPAAIDLPGEGVGAPTVRIRLDPRSTNGTVDMQYAIAVDQLRQPGSPSILSGQRHVGLAGTTLGQLALGDSLLKVEASAWPMKAQANQ